MVTEKEAEKIIWNDLCKWKIGSNVMGRKEYHRLFKVLAKINNSKKNEKV